MVIDGGLVLALVALVVVAWLVFYVLPVPPPVRTGLAVILAVLLIVWFLLVAGLVRFR